MTQQAPPPRKLEDQFVNNVSRYPTYLITVLLGGIWVGLKPFADQYRKSPLRGLLVTLGFGILMLLVHFTLRGMAGQTFLPPWFMQWFMQPLGLS